MLPLEKIVSSLDAIAKQNGIAAHVLGATSPVSAWSGLGKQETFLYLSKADLDTPGHRAVLAQMARRHFQ